MHQFPAELIEIDENLVRAELTPAQRASAIKRRKEVWEAMREAEKAGQDLAGNTGATCTDIPDRGPGRPAEFASETAAATGKNKSTVTRAIRRATEVCQEARDLIRGTAQQLVHWCIPRLCTTAPVFFSRNRVASRHPADARQVSPSIAGKGVCTRPFVGVIGTSGTFLQLRRNRCPASPRFASSAPPRWPKPASWWIPPPPRTASSLPTSPRPSTR